MSILQQVLDMKPSENVWEDIAADLAAVTAATNDSEGAREDLVEDLEDGKENIMSELHENSRSGEVDPQSLVDLVGSELSDIRSKDMGIEKDDGNLSPIHLQNNVGTPLNHELSNGQAVNDLQRNLQIKKAARNSKNSVEDGAHFLSESTDEITDCAPDETRTAEEKKPKTEENILRKRSRSPERQVTQNTGKKSRGDGEVDASASTAGMLEGVDGNSHYVVKLQDSKHKAEWIEPPGTTLLLPPGLEKLHRVFTSLNTACGFLQKQQLEPSWRNVKRALQQLSGTDDVMMVEDIQRLALLCPRIVSLTKVIGEGEDASFNIELSDPSEPQNSEYIGVSAVSTSTDVVGSSSADVIPVKQISDTEARLLVERRQKAFQVSLTHLAQQLQPPPGLADISEHGKISSIHPSLGHQSKDGHHHMGPAILALPTQNLVLTPPPMLPQQLQSSFISISNGYHGLPFPIQVQPANAYAPFGYPQQQANNYAGYRLSSIPSTSQSSLLASNSVSHHAQSHIAAVDLTEPVGVDPSSFYHAQSMNKAKRRRSRNWDTWEVVLLVQAKKNEWERSETASGRDRFETSGERWKKVEKFLKDNKVVDRDAVACKNKWESLLSDYKAIKDWNRKAGNAPYSSITPAEKKAFSLPAVFAPGLLDLMDTFQGKSAHVSPPSVVDSLARQAPTVTGGAGSGGEGSGEEESADALPSAPHGADTTHGSVGKRKKSHGGSSPLVAAFDRMMANMINIEKGRDERSERLLALENRKYELERNKFELQARKLEIEREDRKGLVRVLGNLAGAFHRMADKM